MVTTRFKLGPMTVPQRGNSVPGDMAFAAPAIRSPRIQARRIAIGDFTGALACR